MSLARFSIPSRHLRAQLVTLALAALLFWGYWAYTERQMLARLTPGAWQSLRQPTTMTLYSLDPRNYEPESHEQPMASNDPSRFHGYAILGQIPMTSATDREITSAIVREGVRNWNGRRYFCFVPRHGLRITSAAGTHDFVICFACSNLALHSPQGSWTGIGFTGDKRSLNTFLTAAQIPIAP